MQGFQFIERKIKIYQKTLNIFKIQQKKKFKDDSNYFILVNGKPTTPNVSNLLPNEKFFSFIEVSEFQTKQLCRIAADNNVELSIRFYNDFDFLEVFKEYILTLANKF